MSPSVSARPQLSGRVAVVSRCTPVPCIYRPRTADKPDPSQFVPFPVAQPALAAWQSGNGAMQARPTRLRPVAREPRAAAAAASVGPASGGGERS